jgi:hypothetical protein
MSIRTNLILTFHCGECGKRLCVSNEEERTVDPDGLEFYRDNKKEVPKLPTGAACLYTEGISIEPCRNCIEKYTGPAEKLVEAIKIMSGRG